MVRYAVGYRVARVRHVRRADPAGRLRSRVAQATCSTWRTSRATRSAGSTRCCRRRSSPPRCGRRSRARTCEARVDAAARARCAPPAPTSACATPKQVVEDGVERARGSAASSSGGDGPLPRARPQRAALLRPHRSSTCSPASPHTLGRTACWTPSRRRSSTRSPAARRLERLASRYGMATPTSFARRFIAGETVDEAIDGRARPSRRGACCSRSTSSARASRRSARPTAATTRLPRAHRGDRAPRASTATSR